MPFIKMLESEPQFDEEDFDEINRDVSPVEDLIYNQMPPSDSGGTSE